MMGGLLKLAQLATKGGIRSTSKASSKLSKLLDKGK